GFHRRFLQKPIMPRKHESMPAFPSRDRRTIPGAAPDTITTTKSTSMAGPAHGGRGAVTRRTHGPARFDQTAGPASVLASGLEVLRAGGAGVVAVVDVAHAGDRPVVGRGVALPAKGPGFGARHAANRAVGERRVLPRVAVVPKHLEALGLVVAGVIPRPQAVIRHDVGGGQHDD